MFCVGLTGMIASGKSTVAAYFADYGVHIISADKIARELTLINQPAFQEIIHHFGHGILHTNGELNRSRLREIIFQDATQRKWLELLLHPLIREEIQKRINNTQSQYCMVEIPLLIDRKAYPYLNRMLLVTTSKPLQIARIMLRDQCSENQALAILAAQADINQYQLIADDILHNDGDLDFLKTEVGKLHQQYLAYSIHY